MLGAFVSPIKFSKFFFFSGVIFRAEFELSLHKQFQSVVEKQKAKIFVKYIP